MTKVYKIPVSVLVVIHDGNGQVLIIERADVSGFWQSVTGSQDPGEVLAETAAREVLEETGIDAREHELTDWHYQNVYQIYDLWRHRYAPGVTHNTEHVFGLKLLKPVEIRLAPAEHTRYEWLPVEEAAARCFSPSNETAILKLLARSQNQDALE